VTKSKKQKPTGNTPSQLKLIDVLKAKPTEQGSSNDSSSQGGVGDTSIIKL
jgi:hypothetical protein